MNGGLMSYSPVGRANLKFMILVANNPLSNPTPDYLLEAHREVRALHRRFGIKRSSLPHEEIYTNSLAPYMESDWISGQ